MNTKQSRSAADAASEAYASATALAAEPEGGASDSPDDVVTVKASVDEARRLALETEAVLAGLLGTPVDNDAAREPGPALASALAVDDAHTGARRADATAEHALRDADATTDHELRDALARASLSKGTMPDVSRLVLTPEIPSRSARARVHERDTPARGWWWGALLVVSAVAVGSFLLLRPDSISSRPLPPTAAADSSRKRALDTAASARPSAPARPSLRAVLVEPTPPDPLTTLAVGSPEPSPTLTDTMYAGDPAALLKRAEQLLRKNRSTTAAGQAKELLMLAIAQQNDNPHAHGALAEACLRLRDATCARGAVARAVRLRPKREAYLTLESKIRDAFATP